ncbi:hypothetical protein PUNSTDRAFT_138949, partial [Punctularia strigosozonata HHB-11173 SS5]
MANRTPIDMPIPGTKQAPFFKGRWYEVIPFLDAYEQLSTVNNLDNTTKCTYLLRYCPRQVAEVIEGMRAFHARNWPNLRAEIEEQFSADRADRRFEIQDLAHELKRSRRGHIRNIYSFRNYLREFGRIAGWLLDKGKISEREHDSYFWAGLPRETYKELEARILLLKPSISRTEPYPIDMAKDAARFIFDRDTFDPNRHVNLVTSDDEDAPSDPRRETDQGDWSNSDITDEDEYIRWRPRHDRKRRERREPRTKSEEPKRGRKTSPRIRSRSPVAREDARRTLYELEEEEHQARQMDEVEAIVHQMAGLKINDPRYAYYFREVTRIDPSLGKILVAPALAQSRQVMTAFTHEEEMRRPLAQAPPAYPYFHARPPPFSATYPTASRPPFPKPMTTYPRTCFGCGESGHMMGDCAKMEQLLAAGTLRRDMRGRLMMADGRRIIRVDGQPLVQIIEEMAKSGPPQSMFIQVREYTGYEQETARSETKDQSEEESDEVYTSEDDISKEEDTGFVYVGAAKKRRLDAVELPVRERPRKAKVVRLDPPEPMMFDPANDDHIMEDEPMKTKATHLEKPREIARSALAKHVDAEALYTKLLKTPLVVSVEELLAGNREIAGKLVRDMKITRAHAPEGPPAAVHEAIFHPTSVSTSPHGPLIKVFVKCAGHDVEAIIDTGSQMSILNKKVWDQHVKVPRDMRETAKMVDASGNVKILEGICPDVVVQCGTAVTTANLYVGDKVPFDLLLGRPWQIENRLTIDMRKDGTFLVFKDEQDRVYAVVPVPQNARVIRSPVRAAFMMELQDVDQRRVGGVSQAEEAEIIAQEEEAGERAPNDMEEDEIEKTDLELHDARHGRARAEHAEVTGNSGASTDITLRSKSDNFTRRGAYPKPPFDCPPLPIPYVDSGTALDGHWLLESMGLTSCSPTSFSVPWAALSVDLEGFRIKALLYPAATHTVIHSRIAVALDHSKDRTFCLDDTGDFCLSRLVWDLPIKICNYLLPINAYITPSLPVDLLLGRDWLQRNPLGLVTIDKVPILTIAGGMKIFMESSAKDLDAISTELHLEQIEVDHDRIYRRDVITVRQPLRTNTISTETATPPMHRDMSNAHDEERAHAANAGSARSDEVSAAFGLFAMAHTDPTPRFYPSHCAAIPVKVFGKKGNSILALINTRATVNLIHQRLFDTIRSPPLSNLGELVIRVSPEKEIPVIGRVYDFRLRGPWGEWTSSDFSIVNEGQYDLVLGTPWLLENKIELVPPPSPGPAPSLTMRGRTVAAAERTRSRQPRSPEPEVPGRIYGIQPDFSEATLDQVILSQEPIADNGTRLPSPVPRDPPLVPTDLVTSWGTIPVKVLGFTIYAIIDSGVQLNSINEEIWKHSNIPLTVTFDSENRPDSNRLSIGAIFDASLELAGMQTVATLSVVRNLHVDLILGAAWLGTNSITVCAEGAKRLGLIFPDLITVARLGGNGVDVDKVSRDLLNRDRIRPDDDELSDIELGSRPSSPVLDRQDSGDTVWRFWKGMVPPPRSLARNNTDVPRWGTRCVRVFGEELTAVIDPGAKFSTIRFALWNKHMANHIHRQSVTQDIPAYLHTSKWGPEELLDQDSTVKITLDAHLVTWGSLYLSRLSTCDLILGADYLLENSLMPVIGPQRRLCLMHAESTRVFELELTQFALTKSEEDSGEWERHSAWDLYEEPSAHLASDRTIRPYPHNRARQGSSTPLSSGEESSQPAALVAYSQAWEDVDEYSSPSNADLIAVEDSGLTDDITSLTDEDLSDDPFSGEENDDDCDDYEHMPLLQHSGESFFTFERKDDAALPEHGWSTESLGGSAYNSSPQSFVIANGSSPSFSPFSSSGDSSAALSDKEDDPTETGATRPLSDDESTHF